MPLKIALYYPYIHLRSGVERTILEVLKRSRHDWHVFTNLYEKDTTYPEFEDFKSKITELRKISVERSYFNTLKSALAIFNQKLPVDEFDMLWVHNEGLGSFVNFKNKDIAKVCFCHTPLKIIYDKILKKDYISRNFCKAPIYYLFYFLFKMADRMAFKLYDWCFCVSKEVRNRILENHLLPENKLEVIYGGVDTINFSGDIKYDNYFFHPTRIKWWKNIELSINAFNLMQKKHEELQGFKLVIAGELYPTNAQYYDKLKNMAGTEQCSVPANKNIVLKINPSEQEMMNLYRDCRAVLSTTLNEDFGLTVIEGFSFSKPVIAINRGGPKEIIRNGVTGFLSSKGHEEYADYMARLAENKDLAVKMGAEARKDAIKYDWDNFVSYIDDFFEKIEFKSKKGMTKNLKL